ncbi:MAG TPA: DUF4982 domain-containing protein [Natronincola sp.]|nr:DUF4982 domain-containing protein [Natronincola sp.]
MTTIYSLNYGWEFAKTNIDVKTSEGLTFEPVELPHDWLIYDTEKLYDNSIGWYRRNLKYPEAKRVFIYFEGVYMDCSLFINGQWIGDWKYGYSSFEYEITDALAPGDNEILVKVVHQSPNSRWYSGAGIYRDVWLKLRNDDFIQTHGVYVSTSQLKEDAKWKIEIETELELTSEVELVHRLEKDGEVFAESIVSLEDKLGSYIDKQSLVMENPKRWSPQEPNLYRLVTIMRHFREGEQLEGEVIETKEQNIGFKDVRLYPDKGLLVNGEKLKLNGVCEHHDLGALGSAFNIAALRHRLNILKDMGVNAIRTAHNMPARGLMHLADEMGFFVVSEAFDMWEQRKTTYDYARFFKDWALKDVRSWVRRDRNHPSLLMWSIGNEIYDTHAGERGLELTKMLMDAVREHDPKENGILTFGSNYMPWKNTQICADELKVVGYNYGPTLYEEHHKAFPDWVIYGSETSSVVQSRGIYHFPLEASILADDDEQCSSLGNSPVSWGAKSPENCLDVERETDFSLGQFLWTGFDYIGEPTPYHTKNSYFGQIDTVTFPKDSFYIYQAGWTDYQTHPMVHIFPYWDFNPGQIIDVRVTSNAPRVSLEFNGKLIGEQDMRQPNYLYIADWKIPFEPGELKATAYDEDGNIIATQVRRSFGDGTKIRLRPNKINLQADGEDLIFVEISTEDAHGNPVENASNRVKVNVKGAARLIGLDNGDSTDFDQYKGLSRRLFSGKLMAIIGSTFEKGLVTVEVSSKGLPTETISLKSEPAAIAGIDGITTLLQNTPRPCITGKEDEVPIRKVELICEPNRTLTKKQNEIVVKAEIYPRDASYQDLEWKVVTGGGIESKLAKLEISGNEVKVIALGDGDFRLRCMSKNGTDRYRIISELEFQAEGLGKMYKNPYEFVTGGLYDYSSGEVGTGNERGVATGRDSESQVGFIDLDFGSEGSDTITIPFFTLNNEEYPVQIWEGVPGEAGSELLADVIYQKEMIWNVYQEDTYKLSKRLRGITSLYMVTHNKMHIKGFIFEKQKRALMKTYASENEQIYGDSFTLRGKNVEQIGNNVTLDFGEFDFGSAGISGIILCGKTSLQRTNVQVRFISKKGERRESLEFVQSSEYKEQTFSLDQIEGKHEVRFIFLPGTEFDFSWFRFI